MDEKRELTGAAPESLTAIIAELEAIDRKLAGRAAADSSIDLAAIEKARVRVQEAVSSLTPLATGNSGEDASSAKQRGKGKGSGKSAARSGRKQAPVEPVVAEPAPVPSLLARLGAVTQPAGEPLAEVTPASESPQSTASDKPMNTAERLAQLEAEIADLTEAVTASPNRSAASAIPGVRTAHTKPASGLVLPAGRPASLDLANDDAEDAEIVIVGTKDEPAGSKVRPGRNVPRILAETPAPSAEEDAEVEIRGQEAARAGRLTHARGSGHRSEDAGKGPTGRWRLFRGSR